MRPTGRLVTVVACISLAGCTHTSPATSPPDAPPPGASSTASGGAPANIDRADQWTASTTRGVVDALAGHDGDHHGEPPTDGRYHRLVDVDLGPLPNPINDHQGRTDPAAVAGQWTAIKLLTSGHADGPLWPYSVAGHLRALSDPHGQYVSGGRLDDISSELITLDANTALVDVTADIATPEAAVVTFSLRIELWRDTEGFWLVAFADPLL